MATKQAGKPAGEPEQKQAQLSADVEHSLAEIRRRLSEIKGGMQSHEVQDLYYALRQLMDGLEEELRDEYGA